jgi:hypothetical protein
LAFLQFSIFWHSWHFWQSLSLPFSFYTLNNMSRIWRTIKGYLFWTYTRGSFHYDVMVTLILAFIFIAPHFIDFKVKPPARQPHATDIIASADGTMYQVDASTVDAQDESMVRVNFQRVLRPIAGPVTVERVEQVRDASGHVVAYRAWVRR